MTYYVVYIFAMAGLEGNVKLISSGVQYALFIIFSSIMFFFVDKIGRRTLLVYGAIAMGFCHFVVGGTLGAHYTYVPDGVGGDKNVTMLVRGAPANTVIAFSYLLIILYALTLAPICWVYAAEVWSLETRAWGMGIASTGNWLFNFAIGLFIPPAFINIRWGLFIVFGVLCLMGACQFWLTYPEVSYPPQLYISIVTNSPKRLAAKLSRRSKSCSRMTARALGRQRRGARISTRISMRLLVRRLRARRELASRRLLRLRRLLMRQGRNRFESVGADTADVGSVFSQYYNYNNNLHILFSWLSLK
jgi:hypothetical protein